MDDYSGYGYEPEVSIDADILVLMYGLPMEVFIHLAASGVVSAWLHDEGSVMLECNSLVAVMGQPGYTQRN